MKTTTKRWLTLYRRKREEENKDKRKAQRWDKVNKRVKAKRLVEKKIWHKIPKWYTVDHKKPLSKWWSNAVSNLRIVKAKKNYGDWARLKKWMKYKTK